MSDFSTFSLRYCRSNTGDLLLTTCVCCHVLDLVVLRKLGRGPICRMEEKTDIETSDPWDWISAVQGVSEITLCFFLLRSCRSNFVSTSHPGRNDLRERLQKLRADVEDYKEVNKLFSACKGGGKRTEESHSSLQSRT